MFYDVEIETHEDYESRKARIAKLDGYESLTDREDLMLWLDTHPDRSPDLCHVFGDAQTRGEIDRMYLLPAHLREKEYQNDFMRGLEADWEKNTSK